MIKTGHIALVVSYENGQPVLRETLTDTAEIQLLEEFMGNKESNPLKDIYVNRQNEEKQDYCFGNGIEELLSRPNLDRLLRKQALKWLRAKIKIEDLEHKHSLAGKAIAEYAYKLFSLDPEKSDFLIESPNFRVRVRIFTLPKALSA